MTLFGIYQESSLMLLWAWIRDSSANFFIEEFLKDLSKDTRTFLWLTKFQPAVTFIQDDSYPDFFKGAFKRFISSVFDCISGQSLRELPDSWWYGSSISIYCLLLIFVRRLTSLLLFFGYLVLIRLFCGQLYFFISSWSTTYICQFK